MNTNFFSSFIKKYSLSKTLRFELKPVGKTAEHIKKLLSDDEILAEKYKQAKKIIDEYHKDFISRKLLSFDFPIEELQEFDKSYHALKNDEKNNNLKNDLTTKQDKLRKLVAMDYLQKDIYLYKKKVKKPSLLNKNYQNG